MPFPLIWVGKGNIFSGDFDKEREFSFSFLKDVKLKFLLKKPGKLLKYDKSICLVWFGLFTVLKNKPFLSFFFGWKFLRLLSVVCIGIYILSPLFYEFDLILR